MDIPGFGREPSASSPGGHGLPQPAVTQDELWRVLLRIRGEAAIEEDQRSNVSSHISSISSSYNSAAPTEEDTEHFEEDEGEDDEGHDIEGIEGDEIEQEELDEEDEGHNEDAAFDASLVGLKEISNLASFTVSSYKPGCGVKQLRDDDVNQFWQ